MLDLLTSWEDHKYLTNANSITMTFRFPLRMSVLRFRPYVYRFHQLSHREVNHNCKANQQSRQEMTISKSQLRANHNCKERNHQQQDDDHNQNKETAINNRMSKSAQRITITERKASNYRKTDNK